MQTPKHIDTTVKANDVAVLSCPNLAERPLRPHILHLQIAFENWLLSEWQR